jgi:hypothetical protein
MEEKHEVIYKRYALWTPVLKFEIPMIANSIVEMLY